MSKSEPVAEKQTATKQQAEQTYTLEKLRTNCRELFGVSTTTFAGATAALPNKKQYTVAEIKKVIDEWLKKEAK